MGYRCIGKGVEPRTEKRGGMAKEIQQVAKEGGSSQITENQQGGVSRQGGMVLDANGKFAPGNHSGGRKPKAVEKAYLDALREALPPEEVKNIIAEALAAARKTNSWRGLVEVLALALSYGAGKPVSKTVHTDGNLAELLAALQDDKPLLPASVTVQAAVGAVARLDVSDGRTVIDGSIKRE